MSSSYRYLVAFILFLGIFISKSFQQNQIFFRREEPKFEPPCTTYDGQGGKCRLLVQCTTFFAEIAELSRSPCTITYDQMGVCCPPTKKPTVNPSSVVTEPQREIRLPQVDTVSQNDALLQGLEFTREKERIEIDLVNRNIVVEPLSPVFWHAKLFETNDGIAEQSKSGDLILEASKNLINKFNLNQDEVNEGLRGFSIKDTTAGGVCPPEPTCPEFHYSYRTMDGTCNNIVHKNWGRAGQPFRRKIPALYSDRSSAFRLGRRGNPLPSARVVSTNLSPPVSSPYQNLTSLVWQWGQFLDHDITHTPLKKGANNSAITCCNGGNIRPRADLHPECRPIGIPDTDSFYRPFRQSCMEFVRSAAAIPEGCTFAARQQINQITSYIDGSNVYGSSDKHAKELREFRGGLLKANRRQGRELLPGTPNDIGCRKRGDQLCFLAGDSRVNEQVNLVVMHTVWVRQHNEIAKELSRLNPGWSDELVYQEAKRVVTAQMQHITYNEYLPMVLGREFVETYGLLPQEQGYFRGYDSNVDATIINAFAAAAFRYGHTLITDTLQEFNKLGIMTNDIELSKNQFNPFSLYKRDTLDDLIRGLTKQKSQKVDRFFSEQLTNKLFAGNNGFGMDLVALNIQRGRDHGLPPYTHWQETCRLNPLRSWTDLRSRMHPEVIAHLQLVYEDVNDIDLFIGGISEEPTDGSLLGPTFLCIMGRQFIALKIGDRFFYENGAVGRSTLGDSGEPLSSFNEDQLNEIRKTTLSRILCDNSDNIEVMQPLAFVTGHFANKRAICDSGVLIPRMSLDPWANSRVWAK